MTVYSENRAQASKLLFPTLEVIYQAVFVCVFISATGCWMINIGIKPYLGFSKTSLKAFSTVSFLIAV